MCGLCNQPNCRSSAFDFDALFPFDIDALSLFDFDNLSPFDLSQFDARNSFDSVPETATQGDNQSSHNTISETMVTPLQMLIVDTASFGLDVSAPFDFSRFDVRNGFDQRSFK
ncbi:hypothetical protein VE00_10613 [Pseudogymnoascus sp. WSF 3629]|nr:hypothetical protein VE00_10613 [Pseudogymnoascus sp. WSF 3629]